MTHLKAKDTTAGTTIELLVNPEDGWFKFRLDRNRHLAGKRTLVIGRDVSIEELRAIWMDWTTLKTEDENELVKWIGEYCQVVI
jgi:hypothetical protein